MSIGNSNPESEVCRNLREQKTRLQNALDLVNLGLPLATRSVVQADPMADQSQLSSAAYCLQRASLLMATNMLASAAYRQLYDSLKEKGDLLAQIASITADQQAEDC